MVAPGPAASAPAPSDAIVLFDGKDLSQWRSQKDKGAAKWKVADGFFEVVKGTGGIETVAALRRLPAPHRVAAPSPPVGETRTAATAASSSWASTSCRCSTRTRAATYPDGQAGALYGQFPPLVNA